MNSFHAEHIAIKAEILVSSPLQEKKKICLSCLIALLFKVTFKRVIPVTLSSHSSGVIFTVIIASFMFKKTTGSFLIMLSCDLHAVAAG